MITKQQQERNRDRCNIIYIDKACLNHVVSEGSIHLVHPSSKVRASVVHQRLLCTIQDAMVTPITVNRCAGCMQLICYEEGETDCSEINSTSAQGCETFFFMPTSAVHDFILLIYN